MHELPLIHFAEFVVQFASHLNFVLYTFFSQLVVPFSPIACIALRGCSYISRSPEGEGGVSQMIILDLRGVGGIAG